MPASHLPVEKVFQLTQKLLEASRIHGTHIGRDWAFWIEGNSAEGVSERVKKRPQISTTKTTPDQKLTPAQFESLAADVTSRHFETKLHEGKMPGVHKKFDLVSGDHDVAGDAKYYSMVRGVRLPPAKFSVIAEHVWLLEHTNASQKFLVFGNDRRVPEEWLRRWGNLLAGVAFFFLTDEGELTALNSDKQAN